MTSVYIPPENSIYSTNDPFTDIQVELNSLSSVFTNLCLFGDWNCRTKLLSEFISVDSELAEGDMQPIYDEFCSEMKMFDRTSIMKYRSNKDVGVNNDGYRFITLVI